MEEMGIGAGLGAIAFWGFVATIVVAGVWYAIRQREAQHETLRRMIESGQAVDRELMGKLLSSGGAGSSRIDRDLKISGLIVLPIAPGLAVMGWFLSMLAEDALMPLLGAAVLVFCVGIGLMAAAHVSARWYQEEDAARRDQPRD